MDLDASTIGVSKAAREIDRLIDMVAPTDLPVLLKGEFGVGKSFIARLIHEKSDRRSGPFVTIDLAALAEGLEQSDLFGHVKGAFTGAVTSRIGFLERADGGTLFLDELESISSSLQPKILRFLEDRTIFQVGSTKPKVIDARLITAGSPEIESSDSLRTDLLHRLNAFTIDVPPLRDRKDDIGPLAEQFLAAHSPKLRFSRPAIAALRKYEFPGNIRELQGIVAKASAIVDGDIISPKHLMLRSTAEPQSPTPSKELTAKIDQLNQQLHL